MLVLGFPAQAFGTNCYVIAPEEGEQCVIIDPGIGVMDQLDDLLEKYRLQPAAVMLTHGHLDHTFSVAPVCGARGITAWIHSEDREMLADPGKSLSMDANAMFGGRLEISEPDDVSVMSDGAVMSIAGLDISVDHAPGHTRGSVLFHTKTSEGEALCFSGDVLFRGSIGRTDLWGGSMDDMLASLRNKILPLPDETIVLPGHGPQTTIGRERLGNPYLRIDTARAAEPPSGLIDTDAPTRGL